MAVVTAYGYTLSDPLDGEYGSIGSDLSNLGLGASLRIGRVVEATQNAYAVETINAVNRLQGADFGYDAAGRLAGGTVIGWKASSGPGQFGGEEHTLFSVTGLSVPATTFAGWLETGGVPLAPVLLDGDDSIVGSFASDVLWGYAGNDTIDGNGAGFSMGDADELRGGEGNDLIGGGVGVDDINGNQGNDTVHGGAGDDLAHGGKDNDLLFGDEGDDRVFGDLGDDVVHGNQGDDTLDGGDGADTVRGGQGDDSLSGGAGDDWLSGDHGDDTVSGGAGADVFHSFGEAGIDRVTDFNPGEGDRVMLDPGSAYTVAQAGADTVITLGGGAQMILVGVQLSTLSGDWL